MFYALRKHVEDMRQLRKNWNKLLLGVYEENIWGNLHSKLAYLHHRHKMRKKWKENKEKLRLHPFNMSVTHQSATQIVMQNWISSTGTFKGCVLGKLTIRSICLAM